MDRLQLAQAGDGGIDSRGENSWRLRYRIKGRRITQTFHGTLSDARKELRRSFRGVASDHKAAANGNLAAC